MNAQRLLKLLISLAACWGLAVPGASAQSLLVPGADNQIFFNGFQNVYDGNGVLKPFGSGLQAGDHIVSIVNVQNIDVNGQTVWFSGNQDQLTGIAVHRIVSVLSPDPFSAQPEPHVTLAAPALSQFCTDAAKTDCFNSGLMGGAVLALYRDIGGTNFTSGGPAVTDVARATDGEVWVTLGLAAGPSGDVGYAYSHTDGQFPPPDKAFSGLNAIINNTGFGFFGINDVNEVEIGGAVLFNDVVFTNEIEINPNSTQFGGNSPWLVRINDPATLRPFEMVAGACRFTGGGVDTLAVLDGSVLVGVPYFNGVLESGSQKIGRSNNESSINRYQFGGQAGANTGQQPQPKGEWTHHQQTGPAGSFTFHGGTASAPQGTEIDAIRCSDPGVCLPARRAPVKQLDFDGIGTFKNIGSGKNKPKWLIANPIVTAEGHGNQTFDGTFHWFEVNIDDLGEPGNENSGANVDPAQHPEICPPEGFGEKSGTALADCRCPDYYRITIYNGVDAANVVKNPDGSIDPNSLDRTTVIYEARGYIDGGNLQIHPPTGFDLK